ncbi:MAG: DUF2252 domain-containing protein [Acidimicrobiia bacterium]
MRAWWHSGPPPRRRHPIALPDPARFARLTDRKTIDERAEAGRRARAEIPRSAHGDWSPAAARRSAVDLVAEQNADRLPWLVPIRHGRMLASPFAFFRGAARVMAADLATTTSTGLLVQMDGDAHLANFGTYASPERQLVFDANDFDETLRGPFEWDIKRLAASIAILGRERDIPRREVNDMVAFAVATYRQGIARFAQMPVLELWYRYLSLNAFERGEYGPINKRGKRTLHEVAHSAYGHDHLQALRKLTEEVDGKLRIRHSPPLLLSLRDLDVDQDPDAIADAAISTFETYADTLHDDTRSVLERYRPLDVGIKVVGVGSVGTRCLVLLMEGHDENDPLFLQIKEATTSVYEELLDPSPYDHHGRRVVEGQRLAQSVNDIFLGWTTGPEGRQFYVRQLRDWKYSVDLGTVPIDELRSYAALCAWTLARGHARSGDAVAIDAYVGTNDRLDRAITAFAQDYADLNVKDYEEFRAAVQGGRLEAASDR